MNIFQIIRLQANVKWKITVDVQKQWRLQMLRLLLCPIIKSQVIKVDEWRTCWRKQPSNNVLKDVSHVVPLRITDQHDGRKLPD